MGPVILPWYCTLDDVRETLDASMSARLDRQLRREIEGASRSIEGLTHRVFYPTVATRRFDWPDRGRGGPSWRLWLDQHELISLTELTSGGVAITDYILSPDSGPPYRRIDLDRSSDAVFDGGSTPQRAITATGTWCGCPLDEDQAGELAAGVDDSATTIDVTNSAAPGVGDLMRVDDERMIVTGRAMITTGQTLQAPLSAAVNVVTVSVTDGDAYAVGEQLLVDAERMLIEDIAGDALVVRRSWAGSVLAAHTGSTIYAPRRLTVHRGALGTTAAAHSSSAAVARHLVPGPVRDLAVGETLVRLGREQSGYARTIGAGETVRAAPGGDIRDMRAEVRTRYGRKARKRAV
jgi:hypothetical protein